ncbi:MAG: CoB--CoM heterodisulfide reductase iron-sulfur subunit B family protein [Candidatus Bipolaricaulota bacterium]|nr:CoB--CoM heterodisulfide reductase iron-sulfur subunit B family protein [Candidatus Bipolaricaulota bacterium]MDW8151777.1 CoB--CoM heterodisulfide reductase iron-sulfur subunit B family protein [Candidatus Bipolaricaulota bacterium]
MNRTPAHHPSPITHYPSRLLYFPGCALKDQARGYEEATLAALAALGYEVRELPRWNCCGTVYALAQDDLMRHVGPLRNLIRAQEQGAEELLTLCAMCYHTLSRTARFVQNPENLRRLNAFMDEEEDYRGSVRVLHLVQLLAGLAERLPRAVKVDLAGLRAGAYYGCTLLRPRDVAVDHPERPEVMEAVLAALGAEPVCFPERVECCGAYLTVTEPEAVRLRAGAILLSAAQNGAEVLVTACPLCHFNLRERRPLGAPKLPVVYLGEVLAWALGVKPVPEALAPRVGVRG